MTYGEGCFLDKLLTGVALSSLSLVLISSSAYSMCSLPQGGEGTENNRCHCQFPVFDGKELKCGEDYCKAIGKVCMDDGSCLACPEGSSLTGTGAQTDIGSCKCNDTSHTWNGTACVAAVSCPAGSSLSGSGGETNVDGCRCNDSSAIWDGSSACITCQYDDIYPCCANALKGCNQDYGRENCKVFCDPEFCINNEVPSGDMMPCIVYTFSEDWGWYHHSDCMGSCP